MELSPVLNYCEMIGDRPGGDFLQLRLGLLSMRYRRAQTEFVSEISRGETHPPVALNIPKTKVGDTKIRELQVFTVGYFHGQIATGRFFGNRSAMPVNPLDLKPIKVARWPARTYFL